MENGFIMVDKDFKCEYNIGVKEINRFNCGSLVYFKELFE